MEIIIPVI